jgi:CheY-like chemotaxis protein
MFMSGKRILVVDDHEQIRASISEILLLQGYEVQTVINGKDTLDKVSGFQPDLIVTDILMPDMDGYELLMKKWTDQQIYEIPIIVVSAMISKYDIAAGKALGAKKYLTKPFKTNELIEAIAEFVK